MSLTSHLRDAGSPVRAFLDGVSPVLSAMCGNTVDAHRAADKLRLPAYAEARTVVPPPPGADATVSGTAVDFRTRIALGGFDPRESTAALGVATLPYHAEGVHNGAHRARVLTEAFNVAVEILDSGSSDEGDIDRAAVLLSYCEQIYRAGIHALRGSLGSACDVASTGQDFATDINGSLLTDLRALMKSSVFQIALWRSRIASGERLDLNPRLSGSALVGGADADWLIGDTLIDCKSYASLTVPKLRDFLRQLLGYVMLDIDDALQIRKVGLWLPRQRATGTWTLEDLLGGNPDALLPKLRTEFRRAMNGKQVAIREAVPQRRKHQVLADNKHTPRWMLVELARSNDPDIRFRVGRNPMTPEGAVRLLGQDPYAKPREGVAANECAPNDVLEILSQDSSVLVRRAAASNPRSPRSRPKSRARAEISAPPHPEQPATDKLPLPFTSLLGEMEVPRTRDETALNSRLMKDLLWLTYETQSDSGSCFLPVPRPSLLAAMRDGRSLAAPTWLGEGIPDEIKTDLMRPERPAWIRQFIAQDLPITDPAVRDRLLTDSDPEIRWRALIQTMHTPDEALVPLLSRLAGDTEERIRFRTNGGDPKQGWIRRSRREYEDQTLELVAIHPSTPLASLRDLMSTSSPVILAALIENPTLPVEEVGPLLGRLYAQRSLEQRVLLARSKTLPATAWDKLANDRDPRVRRALAANRLVAEGTLTLLANDRDLSVQLAVLENTSTPTRLAHSLAHELLSNAAEEKLSEVLRALNSRDDVALTAEIEDALDRLSKSRVRNPDMRRIAAGDPRTAPRTLTRLSRSKDESVRGEVAGNPHTPTTTLNMLAKDASPQVRTAVARNDRLDIELLLPLAQDASAEVRASAAKSHKMDAELLGKLLRDDDYNVCMAAFNNPMTSPEDKTRKERDREEAERARLNTAPNRAELENLVAHRFADVRRCVAEDPRTPQDALAVLGGERRTVRVRRAVAANPNTPSETLASLTEDPDEQILQAIAFNSATPAEVLLLLAHRRVDLALLVALNPDVPVEVLDVLIQDCEPLVRWVASQARAARTGASSVASIQATASPDTTQQQAQDL